MNKLSHYDIEYKQTPYELIDMEDNDSLSFQYYEDAPISSASWLYNGRYICNSASSIFNNFIEYKKLIDIIGSMSKSLSEYTKEEEEHIPKYEFKNGKFFIDDREIFMTKECYNNMYNRMVKKEIIKNKMVL